MTTLTPLKQPGNQQVPVQQNGSSQITPCQPVYPPPSSGDSSTTSTILARLSAEKKREL